MVVSDSEGHRMLSVHELLSDCWIHYVYKETVAFQFFQAKARSV